MRYVLLLLLALVPEAAKAACATSWTNGYFYCRQLTLAHSQVPNTDQTNFPALFSGTFSWLATQANGGRVRNSSGFDVIFTSDNAGATKLAWETERYVATTGEVDYWIKIPTLTTAADTIIYVFYGNPSISTDQSNKTGTWNSAFVGVYHLGNGTTLSASDSTSNANNGTLKNTPTATTGQVDGAASFSAASSQYIDAGNPSSFQITGPFTFEGWFNLNSLPASSTLYIIMSKDSGTSTRGPSMYIFNDGTNTHLWGDLYISSSPTTDQLVQDTTSISTSSWFYGAQVFDGSGNEFVYLNGAVHGGSLTTGGTTLNNAAGNQDTAARFATAQDFLDGVVDESRISNVARSADWIATTYNNINAPGTFVTVGSEATNLVSGQFPRVL